MVRRIRTRRAPRRGTRPLNKRQKKQVKSLITRKLEPKFRDSFVNSSSIPSGSGFQTLRLTTVAQGDDDQTRDGDRINFMKFTLRYTLTAGDATNQVRMVVFRWMVHDVIEPPQASTVMQDVVNNSWLSPIKWLTINQGKLHILHDRIYSLSQQGDSFTHSGVLRFYGKKLGRKYIEYTTVSGGEGVGNVYVLCISDSVAIPSPTIILYTRMEFTG